MGLQWDKSLEVWSRRPEKNKDWSKKMNIYSHYDSGLQIQSLKDTTGEDAVIVTEGLDHTRWRIVKICTLSTSHNPRLRCRLTCACVCRAVQ